MRKIFANVLLFCFFAFSINAQAATVKQSTVNINGQTISISILTDNSKTRIVRTDDGKYITLVKYDKINNSINIQETNKVSKTTKITNEKIDTNKVNSIENKINNKVTKANYVISPMSEYIVSSNYSAFWDNAYLYYSSQRWAVWNSVGSYKSRYETSSNSSNLLDLKGAVDKLASDEVHAVAFLGASACATTVAYLTAPSGLGVVVAALTALGFGITGAVYLYDAYCDRDNADFYFVRV